MIPESFIQDLLGRVNVEDVVGQYVKLKKSGMNLFGLCPFHHEKSPSFSVSPQKQFFHCFSCSQGGNAIDFLMKHLGLSFPEAVKQLASQVGMQVPEQRRFTPQQYEQFKEKKTRTDELHECLERAQHHYKKLLKTSPQAIQYLKNRGLDGKTALKYGLGWSGTDRQELKKVFENYDNPLLVDAGLVIEREDLRKYDRFRERVTFPIYNARGKLIGFGGRIIGEGQPKYLNSPETEIFHKGSELYGLFENRQSIHQEGFVLVVEGYMDVVGLSQLGLGNAVATLGTATSAEHLKKLMRITHKIVFSFDGDKAGRRAAWKALTVALPLLRDDVTMRFLFLPEEHDPDSYIREFGQESFREQVHSSLPLSSFFTEELKNNYALEEAEGRAQCLHDVRALLLQIPSSLMIRLHIEKELAKLLLLTHDELKADLAQHQSPANVVEETPEVVFSKPVFVKKTPSPSYPRQSVDSPAKRLLRLLINHPDLLSSITERQLDILNQQENYALVAQFLTICLSKGTAVVGHLQNELEPDLRQIILGIGQDSLHDETLGDPRAEWLGMIQQIEMESLQERLRQFSAKDLEDPENIKRYRQLALRLKNLRR